MFTAPATPGRAAVPPAPTPIRAGRMPQGRCCASSSSIRFRVSRASQRALVLPGHELASKGWIYPTGTPTIILDEAKPSSTTAALRSERRCPRRIGLAGGVKMPVRVASPQAKRPAAGELSGHYERLRHLRLHRPVHMIASAIGVFCIAGWLPGQIAETRGPEAARLCRRQDDFAREPQVAPIKTHLTFELACNYVFDSAGAESAVHGRRDWRAA